MSQYERLAQLFTAIVVVAALGVPVMFDAVFILATLALRQPMGGGLVATIFYREWLVLGALLGGTYACLLPRGRLVAISASLGFAVAAFAAIAGHFDAGPSGWMNSLSRASSLVVLSVVALCGAAVGALFGKWIVGSDDEDTDASSEPEQDT